MTTTIDHNKADVYSRPNARFDGDGQLEIRASAAGNCRRALWYEATGHEVTNPKTEETLTVLEAGNALEPVVLRAMERAGWEVTPADPQDPQQVSVQVGPNMLVTGHPDASGVHARCSAARRSSRSRPGGRRRSSGGGPWARSAATRRRWPRPAFYTLGTYGDLRDAAIATMDTGRQDQWDYELIPADRLKKSSRTGPAQWLGRACRAPHPQRA